MLLIKKLLNNKFNSDLVYNLLSFIIIGISGLIINYIIIKQFGFSILGGFNLIFAIYLVLSQLSVWGIHLSVQKQVPQFAKNFDYISNIVSSALVASLIPSSIITLFVSLSYDIFEIVFRSEYLKSSFIYIVPTIIPFTFNKILLAYLNGMRYMKSFAFYNGLRSLLFLSFICIFTFGFKNSAFLIIAFPLSEFTLLFLLLIKNRASIRLNNKEEFKKLFKAHFIFGNHAFIGHLVLDLNSKVDILMLGFFMTDKLVGIYSFPAFIVDGISQVFYVLRTNINPLITKAYYHHHPNILPLIIYRTKKRLFKYFIIFGAILCFLYPIALFVFNLQSHIILNTEVFIILVLGLTLTSGYIPFQMIFNQVGIPGIQSYFLSLNFITNVALNFIFIPLLGILGAATATSLTFFFQVIYLKKLTSRHIRKGLI